MVDIVYFHAREEASGYGQHYFYFTDGCLSFKEQHIRNKSELDGLEDIKFERAQAIAKGEPLGISGITISNAEILEVTGQKVRALLKGGILRRVGDGEKPIERIIAELQQ